MAFVPHNRKKVRGRQSSRRNKPRDRLFAFDKAKKIVEEVESDADIGITYEDLIEVPYDPKYDDWEEEV